MECDTEIVVFRNKFANDSEWKNIWCRKNTVRFCEGGAPWWPADSDIHRVVSLAKLCMSGICLGLDIGFPVYNYYMFISQPPIQHIC